VSFWSSYRAPGSIDPTRARVAVELRHNSPLLSCRFDPTGRFVFAGSQDNTVQRWELSSQRKTPLEGHRSWVRPLAFHPATRKLLSGDWAGKLLVTAYDADTLRPERALDAHRGWLRAIAVAPDGRHVATCGNDRLVRLWSLPNLSLVREFAGHEWHVYNVAFHPSGRHVVSADLHGVVKQWDVTSGNMTRTLDAGILFHYDPTFRADHGGVRGMAFSADGSLLACSGITDVTNAFAGVGKPAVVLFNWQTGQRAQVLRPQANFQGTAWGVDFHRDGFLVAAGGGSGGALWFWRPDQAQSFHTVTVPTNTRDLHLHPDGRRLAVACFDGAVRVYDLTV
jgi:WD40 repeat protein